MATWAGQRKTLYISIITIVMVFGVGLPAFLFFYDKPTCSDGILNRGEQGVDCGGVCPRLCQSAFLPPSVQWSKLENVAPGLYNLAAYIVNPNTNGAAINIPYKFSLYDAQGGFITDVAGVTTLSPHRNTVAFVGAVNTQKRTPVRAIFEFTAAPNWQKSYDTLDKLSITNKQYNEDADSSSLTVKLTNEALLPYTNVYVFAILADSLGNTIGFSRTYIDEIAPESSAIAPFTWPVSHSGRVASIEILPIVVPVIDTR